MIARVVPALRLPTDGFYDYKIEDGVDVCPGAIVRVPWRNGLAVGVVWELVNESPVPPARLRSLKDTLTNGAATFPGTLRTLAERLALHHRVPLPLLLLTLLPKFPSKTGAWKLVGRSEKPTGYRPELRQVRTLFDDEAIRSLIQPLLSAGPLLILAPTTSHARWLLTCLKKHGVDVAYFDGSLGVRESAAAWMALIRGAAEVLVTTRSGVFAPATPQTSLLIFAEEEPSFFQFDAAPQFDARHLARLRARAESRPLVMVGEAPTLNAYAVTPAADRHLLVAGGLSPTLVRLDHARRAGERGIFTSTALEAISQALAGGRQAVICVNRKGAVMQLHCADCSTVLVCTACKVPLRQFFDQNFCSRCGTKRAANSLCDSCGSDKIIRRGLTVMAAADELRQRLPMTEVEILDPKLLALPLKRPIILIGTEALCHSFRPFIETLNVGAVVAPRAEQLLGVGNYRDDEEGYALLRSLQALAERQGAPFILQTALPNHTAIRAISEPAENFYHRALEERDELEYPPAQLIIVLSVPAHIDCQTVHKTLRSMLPVPARLDQIEKNRYIVRFPTSEELLPTTFRHMPADWSWQVNPRSLTTSDKIKLPPS